VNLDLVKAKKDKLKKLHVAKCWMFSGGLEAFRTSFIKIYEMLFVTNFFHCPAFLDFGRQKIWGLDSVSDSQKCVEHNFVFYPYSISIEKPATKCFVKTKHVFRYILPVCLNVKSG